jgi:GAF domain
MAAWGRRILPLAAVAVAISLALLLEPITDRAWAPAVLPAIVIATWATGWIGGLLAIAVGFAGRVVLIAPYPWTRPGWMTSWLVVHAMAIVITEVARRAQADRLEARRIQREQAARATKAIEARRAEFLAHASDLFASSRDYPTTLAAVANLAVPLIADLCVVDIVNENGEFTPLAIAHVDPGKVELVRELRRLYPLDPKAPYGPPRVLRTGQSIVYTQLPDSAVAETAIDPSELRVAVALGIRSTMAVPLLVGGRRLGVISFATTGSGRTFVASDVQFAEDLARRAAIAIDTARP